METPVLKFAERLARVPGARKVVGKLNAYTFDASALPEAVKPLIAEVEQLVADVSGAE